MKYKLSKLFIVRAVIFRTLLFICMYFILQIGIKEIQGITGIILYSVQLVVSILYVILGLVGPIIEFFSWSYFIFDDFIEIRYGVLFKRYICIKIDKIKYINIFEDPISMLLRINSVNIYTAGGKVGIPSLRESQAKMFYDIVKENI